MPREVSDDEEAALLLAVAAGDTRAFAGWMRGAEPRLRASLGRFAQHVDVEAVLQETLLRTWQVAPRVVRDEKGDSLFRVALRIARNLAIDEARRLRAAPLSPDLLEPLMEAEAPVTADPLLRERIERCRDGLPSKPRLALRARIEARGARSDAELADSLGMRTNTYLQNLTRARRLLLACLERLGVRLSEVLG